MVPYFSANFFFIPMIPNFAGKSGTPGLKSSMLGPEKWYAGIKKWMTQGSKSGCRRDGKVGSPKNDS